MLLKTVRSVSEYSSIEYRIYSNCLISSKASLYFITHKNYQRSEWNAEVLLTLWEECRFLTLQLVWFLGFYLSQETVSRFDPYFWQLDYPGTISNLGWEIYNLTAGVQIKVWSSNYLANKFPEPKQVQQSVSCLNLTYSWRWIILQIE